MAASTETMAAGTETQPTESTHDATGIRKLWNETVQTVHGRIKDVEKAWNDAFAQVNSRLILTRNKAETEAREFVKKVEEDSKTRLGSLREQLRFDDLIAKLKTDKIFEHGAKLTLDTVERLGLATREEFGELTSNLKKLSTKIESVRKKTNEMAASKDLKALAKRVAVLEKATKVSAAT